MITMKYSIKNKLKYFWGIVLGSNFLKVSNLKHLPEEHLSRKKNFRLKLRDIIKVEIWPKTTFFTSGYDSANS